ncbi:hypothetical protein CYMTET_22921 [Cymbomonas tetramitiformis]|uniref:Uncharacterized protein n=1 Tax=Cymbomonas tetramitiformis TaxID=36881 RepID=A0AAE0L1G0_9CHLO|nr:hypothetical protein CYMTET_22921 [Cymbomonas tetramitiformis]
MLRLLKAVAGMAEDRGPVGSGCASLPAPFPHTLSPPNSFSFQAHILRGGARVTVWAALCKGLQKGQMAATRGLKWRGEGREQGDMDGCSKAARSYAAQVKVRACRPEVATVVYGALTGVLDPSTLLVTHNGVEMEGTVFLKLGGGENVPPGWQHIMKVVQPGVPQSQWITVRSYLNRWNLEEQDTSAQDGPGSGAEELEDGDAARMLPGAAALPAVAPDPLDSLIGRRVSWEVDVGQGDRGWKHAVLADYDPEQFAYVVRYLGGSEEAVVLPDAAVKVQDAPCGAHSLAARQLVELANYLPPGAVRTSSDAGAAEGASGATAPSEPPGSPAPQMAPWRRFQRALVLAESIEQVAEQLEWLEGEILILDEKWYRRERRQKWAAAVAQMREAPSKGEEPRPVGQRAQHLKRLVSQLRKVVAEGMVDDLWDLWDSEGMSACCRAASLFAADVQERLSHPESVSTAKPGATVTGEKGEAGQAGAGERNLGRGRPRKRAPLDPPALVEEAEHEVQQAAQGVVRDEEGDEAGGAKAGRGRPRKNAPPDPSPLVEEAEHEVQQAAQGVVRDEAGAGERKRGRGRPRKNAPPDPSALVEEAEHEVQQAAQGVVRDEAGAGERNLGRGRPRKRAPLDPPALVEEAEHEVQQAAQGVVRDEEGDEAGAGERKRGRGRPRKNAPPDPSALVEEAEHEVQQVAQGVVQDEAGAGVQKRGQGRPRKVRRDRSTSVRYMELNASGLPRQGESTCAMVGTWDDQGGQSAINLAIDQMVAEAGNQRQLALPIPSPVPGVRPRSRFEGVLWDEGTAKWRVQIRVLGCTVFDELYEDEVAAARMYNRTIRVIQADVDSRPINFLQLGVGADALQAQPGLEPAAALELEVANAAEPAAELVPEPAALPVTRPTPVTDRAPVAAPACVAER